MWQTKYTSAIPKNLGVGVDFWPCSEDNFFTGRSYSVPNTKYRPLSLLPQLFKNAPKMHQCRVCRAGQVRTSKRACGHAGVRRGWANRLRGMPAGRRANGQFLRGTHPTGPFYDVSLREAISL